MPTGSAQSWSNFRDNSPFSSLSSLFSSPLLFPPLSSAPCCLLQFHDPSRASLAAQQRSSFRAPHCSPAKYISAYSTEKCMKYEVWNELRDQTPDDHRLSRLRSLHSALTLFAHRTCISTSARSIGFCAIWVCISSSSSSEVPTIHLQYMVRRRTRSFLGWAVRLSTRVLVKFWFLLKTKEAKYTLVTVLQKHRKNANALNHELHTRKQIRSRRPISNFIAEPGSYYPQQKSCLQV